MFAKTYSMTKGVMGDYAVADSAGRAAAQAEADASGGTQYTLDKGMDDKAMPDYSAKDKADIDMIAGQENDIRAMQGETIAQPAVAAPAGLGDPGFTALTARRTESVVPGTSVNAMSAVPAPGTTAPPGLEQAPTAAAPEEGYTRGEITKPQLNASDIYQRKYAPKVVERLMAQGNDVRAKEYETWSRSKTGAAYGESWLKAVGMEQAGDYNGAMSAVQDIYNKQLPNGKYATAVPGKDGQYTVEVRDEKTNKLLQQFAGKAPDLTQAMLNMGKPEEVFKRISAAADNAASEKKALAKEERGYTHAEKMEGIKAANKEEKRSPMMQLQSERDAMFAANPKDPNIKVWDRKIKNVSSSGENPGGNITVRLQGGEIDAATGNRYVFDPTTGNTSVRPVPGMVTEVTQAQNYMAGFEYRLPRPGAKYLALHRTSDGEMASTEEEAEYGKSQVTLRKRGNNSTGLK